MKKNTPYQSSGDCEYDNERRKDLNTKEKEILKALEQPEDACIVNKSINQLSRELNSSNGELRTCLHRLVHRGLIRVEGEEHQRHYKLTRAGERCK